MAGLDPQGPAQGWRGGGVLRSGTEVKAGGPRHGWAEGRCACQVGYPPSGCIGPGTERARADAGSWVPRGSGGWLSLCKGLTLTPLPGPAFVGLSAGRSCGSVFLTAPHTEISGCPWRPASLPLLSRLRPPGAWGPRSCLTHPRAGRPPRGRCRRPRRWAVRPSRCR